MATHASCRFPSCLVVIFNMCRYGDGRWFSKISPSKEFFEQQWIGFENFRTLFFIDDFSPCYSQYPCDEYDQLAFGTTGVILLALSLNEVNHWLFKRSVQTISYLPHFSHGLLQQVWCRNSSWRRHPQRDSHAHGLHREPHHLPPRRQDVLWIIGFSNLWKGVGWGSIIYLSAIAGIDQGDLRSS